MHSIPLSQKRRFRRGTALFVLSLAFLRLPIAHAIKVDPNTPEDVILSKGFSAYMDGKDREALSYFEEAVRINPRNQAAQKGLSKVKIRLKKSEDVEKAKSRRLADAKVREGRALEKTGDIVAAIDSYHQAVDALPDCKPALNSLKSIRTRMLREIDHRRLNLSLWAFSRGVVAYLDRDWARAYKIWSERARIEPKNIALANATARAENNFKKLMLTEREEFFRRGGRAFYEQGLYLQSKNSWDQVLAIRNDDLEALEGRARSEEALLKAQGKGRDDRAHELLEQGLEYYANQSWTRALETFTLLSQLDPDFSTAKEYIAKINSKLSSAEYHPAASSAGNGSWRASHPSNPGDEKVDVPDQLENFDQRRNQLKTQLSRDPGNLRAQQELDKVTKQQEEEAERIYKDGLIAYSQGNRALAMQHWRKVIVIYPEHKKAMAALKKAKAEEERSSEPSGGDQ